MGADPLISPLAMRAGRAFAALPFVSGPSGALGYEWPEPTP